MLENNVIRIHPLRLLPGQDLKQAISTYVKKEKIEAGWIMTGVGSLTQTNLRFANQSDGRKSSGFFEIVSLTGTVSIHGLHLHLSVSDNLGQTIGGHLLEENLVYTTVEIVIGESKEHIFTREKDSATRWLELVVKRR